MNLESLAKEATEHINLVRRDWELKSTHGIEIAPGFFNIFNERTGQSRVTLYHPESGYIFKTTYVGDHHTASGSYLGEVEIDGISYRIRLPEFYYFAGIEVQEYVVGENHDCNGSYSCEHTHAIADETGYFDTHTGNWKIVGSEIVYFDYN